MVIGHRVLVIAGVLVAAGGLVACSSTSSTSSKAPDLPAWHYVSRPDLTPPVVIVSRTADSDGSEEAGSYVFLGTKGKVPLNGALVVDTEGQPVWIGPAGLNTYNERVQTYAGKPVLTYWQGRVTTGKGFGEVVVLDQSYEQIATVTTGGAIGEGQADIHESRMTPAGTMLLTAYVPARADLSEVGGPQNGWVWDGVVQEVDVATGDVVFEWHSVGHVPVSETAIKPKDGAGKSKDNPFDYFHINSVSEDTDGSLLVGARNTSAVYDVSRATGEVVWTLGGRNSDFTLGPHTRFEWQHDAQRQPDGTLTLFDNESTPAHLKHSRGLRLSLDMATMTTGLVGEYLPPDGRLALSQGSLEVLESGNVLIGWGQEPQYSLYTPDGRLLLDADIGGGTNYRAYLGDWTATPGRGPDVAVKRSGKATTAYVSWNGATEVRSWRLRVGAERASMRTVATVPRTGFETAIVVPDRGDQLEIQALDATGTLIGAVRSHT